MFDPATFAAALQPKHLKPPPWPWRADQTAMPWFWDDILGAGALLEGAGAFVSFNGVTPVVSGTFGTGTGWAISRFGPALNFDGSAGQEVPLNLPKMRDVSFPYTIVIYCLFRDNNDVPHPFQSQDNNIGAGEAYNGVNIEVNTTSTNNDFTVFMGDGGGTSSSNRRNITWAGAVEFNEFHIYAATVTGLAAATGYKDGVALSAPSTSGTGSGIANGSNDGFLGGGPFDRDFDGEILSWGLINRGWSAAEHRAFAIDPFGPFRPDLTKVLGTVAVPAAAPGGVTVPIMMQHYQKLRAA